MKNILLATFLTAIFASGALGQSVILGFRADGVSGGTPPVYSMDSLWQFGIPTKSEFEWESTVGPYRLCTDTSEYIRDTGRWEMCFGVSRDTLDFINNCLFGVVFDCFNAKYDGIPDSTGLLVEVSPDSVHWYNLLDSEDEAAYVAQTGISSGFANQPWIIDTVGYLDGEPVWVNGDEWVDELYFGLHHDWTLEDAGSVMEAHFRLTYISKTTTPHAGIAFVSPQIRFIVWCEGIGIDETRGELQANLYPNPVTACSTFDLPTNTQYPVRLTIMDPNGRILHRQTELQAKTIPFPRISIYEGIYMYSIIDAAGNYLTGSFIVEP